MLLAAFFGEESGRKGCRFGEVEDGAVFDLSVFDPAGEIVGEDEGWGYFSA